MKPVDKLNLLYERYKDKFDGQFHSLLWKVIVDEVRDSVTASLTPCITSNGTEIGIADYKKKGYTPTGVWFKPNIIHDDAEEICHELNTELFGQSIKTQMEIVLSSL